MLEENIRSNSKKENAKNVSIPERLECPFLTCSPKVLQFILQVPAPMSPLWEAAADTAKQHLVPLCAPWHLTGLHY